MVYNRNTKLVSFAALNFWNCLLSGYFKILTLVKLKLVLTWHDNRGNFFKVVASLRGSLNITFEVPMFLYSGTSIINGEALSDSDLKPACRLLETWILQYYIENRKGKDDIQEILLKKQTKQNAGARMSDWLAWIFWHESCGTLI